MLLPLAVSGIALLLAYCYIRLRYMRLRQYAHLPQMSPSLVLGHLKLMDSFIKGGKLNGHPDLAFQAINEALGKPAIMFMDLRPFGPPMAVVRSHEIAEQVSKAYKQFPYSLPKMTQVYGHMAHVTGRTSILGANGEEWKHLRKRFNAAFSPQQLISFLPRILEKCMIFFNNLDHFAASGDSFSMINLTGSLIFDVITSVTMDVDFGAQARAVARNNRGDRDSEEFVAAYHDLFETYASEGMDIPWFLTPFTEWKRRRLSGRVRARLRTIVRDAYNDRRNAKKKKLQSRSILSLSLEDDETGEKDGGMAPQAPEEACDQLSTFLFAGHDTTSILLSWLFYELSRTPHALARIRQELDGVFGPDSNLSIVREKLLSEEARNLLNSMTYTAACIKETLRLWPPAGTARRTTPEAGIRVQTSNGESYALEGGINVYNCAIMVHRDVEEYGDTADVFVPERWLQEGVGMEMNEVPASAWRAFERGPRNCIGQELVNIEARVIVAPVARRYDFVKVRICFAPSNGQGRIKRTLDIGSYSTYPY
ncbi:cytochrome P450 [Xylariaceae sp. FL0594]|nr:cytochrome P450 [Xylariaceae sp. FL0594]